MNTLAHYQLYIDGSYCDGSQGQVENSINPATNQPWATFACASEDDVNRAVKAAKRALNDSTWRDICLLYTSPSPRDATLSRMPSSA